MAFWRGERLLGSGSKLISPFDEAQIDCNAYVLRMGDRYFRTSDSDGAGDEQKKLLLKPGESFVIPPGQFAYLLSKEEIKVPANAMAFISMRTQLKFQGLINVSGFHVDPGYEGQLLYAAFNASPTPIPISENELLFKIWFCDLDGVPPDVVEDSGPSFIKHPEDAIRDIDNKLIHGMSPPIISLQGLAAKQREQEQNLTKLRSDIDSKFDAQKPTIDSLAFIWRGLNIAALVAIIGTVLSLAVRFGWPIADEAGRQVAARMWQANPSPEPPKPKLPSPQAVQSHSGASGTTKNTQ